jgi:NADPH2:quinone reductase
MRYIHMRGAGGPEVLQLQTRALPEPGAGEVLIRVNSAGVNRPDILQREGAYPPPADASRVLGLEVAGEVYACGEGVECWRVGDRVCALVNGGGYADYALAPASQCLPIPEGLSMFEAAALPEAFFTVWHNLWQRAHLSAGETLLVHGGSSGIGTTAIQLARAMGVQVFATAGNDDKCRACEQLGAAKVINYRKQDFVTELKNFTHNRGVDVILDMVGGDYIARNIAVAAREGRIVNIAYLNGSRVTVDFMPVMIKRLTLTGSTLRAQSARVKAQLAAELEAKVWPLIASGQVAPVIAASYPLEDATLAHQLMESGQHIGKILLRAGSDSV